MTVTLGYNTAGLNQSEMLREVICSRGIITERHEDLEMLSRYYHNVGNLPAYILAGDVDRWHVFIYAAETLRQHPEFRDVGIGELNHVRNREFDKVRVQPKIDGVLWGAEEYFDEIEAKNKTPDVPIKEQIIQKKIENIDRTRSEAVPAEVTLTQQGPDDAYTAKWVQAEKMAEAPRESWEGKCNWDFEQMIKYCYAWIQEIGNVPEPYPMDPLDLFWQRPLPHNTPLDEKSVARRTYMSYKVQKFWRKSVTQKGVQKHLQVGRRPLSYRVVLAAKRLAKCIEDYAVNWQTDDKGIRDEHLQERVKKAAMQYFKAHFPIETTGAKPGPLDTLDPGYVDYIRLCRKYQIKRGTLLHEADL